MALPYTVIKQVGSHAVQLDTPPGIHPVFHVNLIRRLPENPLPSQQLPDFQPPAITPSEETQDLVAGEHRIDDILQHRRRGVGFQLLVKWTGWPEPTWEPLSHFSDTAALEAYELNNTVPWEERRERMS